MSKVLDEIISELVESASVKPNKAVTYWLASFKEKKIRKFEKYGVFDAEKVENKQRVKTIIDGKVETTNTANVGDYILTGASGEEYAVKEDTFKKRYAPITVGGKTKYKAVGACYGVMYTGEPFKFTAPWGEEMVCENNDMIVSTSIDPDKAVEDVYRIEYKTFRKTYVKI